MIDPAIYAHIVAWLGRIEAEEGVRILFAAESGSRAWGFASPDSDYDVRFIYAHPVDWYLGLSEARDVIERPLDEHLVDLAGWDLRKALRLLLKSNAALYEWFASPIIYRDDGAFRPAARALFERRASPQALAHHYHSVALGQWQREIDGREAVKLKKYFYAVRPILSLQWVIERGGVPPMDLDSLLAQDRVPAALRTEIDTLLQRKRHTAEFGLGPHNAVLDHWLRQQLDDLAPGRQTFPPSDTPGGFDDANQLFRSLVKA